MQVGWVKIGDFRQITGYISTRSSAIAEGPRDASCQFKSCQLPRNSAETTCTTSPEQIEVMKLEDYHGPISKVTGNGTMTLDDLEGHSLNAGLKLYQMQFDEHLCEHDTARRAVHRR